MNFITDKYSKISDPNKKYYLRHKSECFARTTKIWKRNQAYLRQYKEDHPCNRCGEIIVRKLLFHHRNPIMKRFKLGCATCSLKLLKAELNKCDVVCTKCHSHIHRGGSI